MKIVNLILAVMFLLFAFVQVNDPDPILWILIYGAMAVVCILAAFKVYQKWLLAGMLVGLIAYSSVFLDGVREWWSQEDKSALFDDVAKMEHIYIEESREFLGLMICVAVLIFQLIRSRSITR